MCSEWASAQAPDIILLMSREWKCALTGGKHLKRPQSYARKLLEVLSASHARHGPGVEFGGAFAELLQGGVLG